MTEALKPSTKTPITMTDGRVVDFNTKQKLVKTSTITDEGVVSCRLDFRNGETRDFTIPSGLMARAAAHGIEQKLGDATAGEASDDDAVLAVDDLIKRLAIGEWNVTRAAGSFTGTSILIKALMEASGKTVEDIKAFLENKTQAEKLALRKTDKLRPIIERLESEKAKNSKNAVDTDSLLGELGLGVTEKKAKTPA
jgi:hypothetical protein